MTNADDHLDDEMRHFAAPVYGEASTADDDKEMFALASVLFRQMQSRGHPTIKAFLSKDKTFSFAVSDGNKRYAKLMSATSEVIRNDKGMRTAVDAAKNAKSNGTDYSNGAFFWDGADIKSHYSGHFKVKHGIRFSDPAHNIYGINESTKLVVLSKIVKKKIAGKLVTENVEVGRYDHIYESTAAYGGTIFWRQSHDYLTLTKAKPYL